MSRYNKTLWDTNTVYNPTNMNHIEQGIYDADLREGGTISGDLIIDGTTSRLFLGNNTNNNIRGIIRIHNTNGKFVQLYPNNTTADRNIELPDKSGTMALTSDFNSVTSILDISNIPSSQTSYDCNWQNYEFLFIYSKQFGNIFEQIIVPYSYFSTTSDGKRVMIHDGYTGGRYQIYRNGNGKVYIVGTTPNTSYRLEICGYISR